MRIRAAFSKNLAQRGLNCFSGLWLSLVDFALRVEIKMLLSFRRERGLLQRLSWHLPSSTPNSQDRHSFVVVIGHAGCSWMERSRPRRGERSRSCASFDAADGVSTLVSQRCHWLKSKFESP